MVLEKKALAENLTLQDDQFTAEVSRRKILEADLAWFLQKGVVRVVDRVVESSEFALGIHCVKFVCVVAGIKMGKWMARVWSVGSGPGSSDPDTATRSVEAMHAAIKAFAETDFTSYLHLVEIILSDLFQLCSEEEELALNGSVKGAALTQPCQG